MAIKQFVIHKGEDGRIYWRAVAGNNEIVADGQGYEQWGGAADCVRLLLDISPDVKIIDLTGDDRVTFPAETFRKVLAGGRGQTAGDSERPAADDLPPILING